MVEQSLTADIYFENATKWHPEFQQLRRIVLTGKLNETIKWGNPCYTLNNKNVVLIHGFKEYCALLFFNGKLLIDKHNMLIQQTENVQAARQMRFMNVDQILANEKTIKEFIAQAINNEKAGLKVELKKTSKVVIVEELDGFFNKNSAFKKAFFALTPGRQTAYNYYFASAKQTKTRQDRIEKSIPNILNGKGLNDCTCGLSKKLPACDGSHKFLKLKT